MGWTEKEELPDFKAAKRNPRAFPDLPVGEPKQKKRREKLYTIEGRYVEATSGVNFGWLSGEWSVWHSFVRKEDRDHELAKMRRRFHRSFEFRPGGPECAT